MGKKDTTNLILLALLVAVVAIVFLGRGTSVVIQDKTTLLNLLTGTLTSRSSSSYISTMTVGITIASATIGSTGTYSNWLISLGGA